MINILNNKIVILAIVLLTSVTLMAQQTVEGVIVDAETNEALIGANVQTTDGSSGTISDINGSFELPVSSLQDTLEVSYVGYQSRIVPLEGRSNLELTLFVNSNQLDEFVVVGYGTQKKREVTGATSRIGADEIEATPILRVEQSLQGRTSGVQVTNLSGQPGEEPTVRIRGTGTTGNSKPLYIVDGLAVGGIDYLNPGDIETIDVLKDAASAAIYGARAANGVVLITTKSGSKGKMSLSYSGYYGIQNVAKKVGMLDADQYRILMNEGARNSGLTEPFDLNEVAPNNTNWQDELFFENAPMQNHQISITGGNDKSSFASTMSYFTQEGIIGGPKSMFERYTGRINSSHKVSSKFRFGNNLAVTHLEVRGVGSNQSFNGPYSSALNLDPLTPLIETDPDILSQSPYSTEPVVRDDQGNPYGISTNVGAEIVNPLALIQLDNDKTRKDQLVGNVYGEFEPIKGLTFKSSLGVDLAFLRYDGFRPLFYLNGAQLNVDKSTVSKTIERYYTWQWENTALYEKEIGDHKFSGLIGTTALEFQFEDLSGFNADVPTIDPDNVYLNLAQDTLWTASGGARHSALFSVFGRANYSYNDKYSVSAVIRRDGSSKFGANRRFGIFPSLGVAWVASEEEFIQSILNVDLLKIRASWGVNGNQEIGDFQFVSLVDKTRGYDLGGGREVGASPLFIENADIGWEESEQYNLGFDIGILNNRLQATVDFYVKNTKDLLERIPIPGHVGNEGPIANVGSVQNRGIELGLSWRHAVGDWNYELGLNGAYNQNKMTKIGNAEKVITGASWAIAGPVTRSEEGLPISYFWGYKTDGIFQNQAEVFSHFNDSGELLQPKAVPGDVRFVDVNGDGVINEEDRTNIGNPIPDFTFGFNASVNYKQFDFSMFIQGTYGNDIFNGTQRQDLRFTNRTDKIEDRWTGEGTSNEIPRYAWIDVNNNYRVSDLYIEDGSFARIKNMQLGYKLPKSVLSNIGAVDWRFYVSVENLYTFTRYTGVDPEIGAISSFDIGIDRAVYPLARTMRFGTTLTF